MEFILGMDSGFVYIFVEVSFTDFTLADVAEHIAYIVVARVFTK